MNSIRSLLCVAALALGTTICPAVLAAGDAAPARPEGLDQASWASLKGAIGAALPQTVLRIDEGSRAGADGEQDDFFGITVAVDGQFAVVGASLDDVGGLRDSGSAYVFERGPTGWTLATKLVADDATSDAYFGVVAIDGDTILVGASGARIGGSLGQGAVYVFARSGSAWTQRAKLTATDGRYGDGFGGTVALSGNTALVGAISAEVGQNPDQGAAYVFVRSGETWLQQARLTASDAGERDRFGGAVALEGDTALVGADYDAIEGNGAQGSVYVFARSGTVWTEQAKLTASDGTPGSGFGRSVALQGSTALVGAWYAWEIGGPREGSAYVFARSGSAWTQQQKLVPGEPDTVPGFGAAVALDDGRALVGARWGNAGRGAAFVFASNNGSWTRQAVLTRATGVVGESFGLAVALDGDSALIGMPYARVGGNFPQGAVAVFGRQGTSWIGSQELDSGNGRAGAFFGWSVAVDEGIALVGAPDDDLGGADRRGAAYVFIRAGSRWHLQARLEAVDGGAGDRFGEDVALSAGTAVVGAPSHAIGSNTRQGAAYVFVREGGLWIQRAKLTASDGASGDGFGGAVTIDGDTVLSSAGRAQVGMNATQGAAYVFTRSGSVWTQQAKLVADDGEADDQFGSDVALSGSTALVGTLFDDVGANLLQGSAYVFVREGTQWTQQAQLVALDGAARDYFGGSVALEGDTAVVGASSAQVGMDPDQGAVYIFTRSDAGWSQQARLTGRVDASIPAAFGGAVGIDQGWIVVGAPFTTLGSNIEQGAAYVFSNRSGSWTQESMLIAHEGSTYDGFGWAVAVDGGTVLVGTGGAHGAAPYGNPNEGAAYLLNDLDLLFESGFEAGPARGVSKQHDIPAR